MKKIIFTLMAMLFSTMCYCQNGVWKGEGVTFIFEETTITIVDTISIGDVKRERSRILTRDRRDSFRNENSYYYSVQTLFGIERIEYRTYYTKFDDERIVFKVYCMPFNESKSFSLTKDVKASEAKALKHTNPFDESKSFSLTKHTKVKDNVDGVYAF